MAQAHRSDARILGRRTLAGDHRILAAMLRPGMTVLDVGCGTGAITFGIAKAVGESGRVVAVDRDAALIENARKDYALPNIEFEVGDAASLPYRSCFDIATAARTIQWTSEPIAALIRMKEAVKPRGTVVILDYNHAANGWEPEPPREFREFYQAFLAWREATRWDNLMADHLPELMREAGLTQIEILGQDEVAKRGDPDFERHADVWRYVIENLGEQLTTSGFLSAGQLRAAGDVYMNWIAERLMKQTMVMRTVVGGRG